MPDIKMVRRRTLPVQLSLSARGRHGGYRAGAGRKAKRAEDRKGHRARPLLAERFPVHVTLKLVEGAPYLRRRDCFGAVRSAFAASKERDGFRLVHFSVQGNHMHLLCEGKDKGAFSRGMHGLAIRVARRVNACVGRSGKVFAERYHARILRSPTEVRRALAYVLNNSRRHAPGHVTFPRDWIDPMSSAPSFFGWRGRARVYLAPPGEGQACVASGTWLLAKGWRLGGGLIATDEVPGEE